MDRCAQPGGPRRPGLGRDRWRGPATDVRRERGGSRLCSPGRAGGVDGGERGDTLRQPAGGLTSERATTSCAGPVCGRQLPWNSYLSGRRGRAVRLVLCTAKAPGTSRRAATSAEPLRQPAPGPRRAPADACRRPRVGTARTSKLSMRAAPRHGPRMHAEGPGHRRERGSSGEELPVLAPGPSRALCRCTAKARGSERGRFVGQLPRRAGTRHVPNATPAKSSALVRWLGVSLVLQEGLMRVLRRPDVDAQVVPAGRIELLVPEQLLDMPDWTAVE
jgi:hypothetical protein